MESTSEIKPAWEGSRAAFFAEKGVLSLLPMMYVAWSDGVLTPTEIETIHSRVLEQSWLSDDAKSMLAKWLDPMNPPSVSQLQDWLRAIREATQAFPDMPKDSLASLGLEMAKVTAAHEPDKNVVSNAYVALSAIEDALGVVSVEACRSVLWQAQRSRIVTVQQAAESTVDVGALSALLDGEDQAVRHKVRTLLSDPVFAYDYDLSKEDYRERVLEWLGELAQRGYGALSFPEEYGGGGSMRDFMTTFETIGYHDLSLLIKFGVQFGLFGGSIQMLGTHKHHKKYLKDVGSLALPGCFAMTEIGHGSNVRDIDTVATYSADTDSFVIHSPNEEAGKTYIGNAATHGRLASVFAQLEVGDENHGVHAFLVPIRNEDGSTCDGVRIEDNGAKLGLNGVDNGKLWFNHVRIPRENLLDRFGSVHQDGTYHSDISSLSRRFFTMLGTLVGGRVSVAAGALSAAKSGLAIAIRYAAERRQFGPAGKPEMHILDYRTHQRRLMPLLARAYAVDFALKDLKNKFVNHTGDDMREIEVMAAGLKSFSTWNTTETLQTCRECCGGQGYIAENRFAALKADTDVFTTFEGDNTVLMQLVAKGLLTEYKEQFSDLSIFGVVRYLAEQASVSISEQNPLIVRLTDEEHLRDPEFHLAAMQYREHDLLSSVSQRLRKKIKRGEDSFEAFNDCQDHLMALAQAHMEHIILAQFQKTIEDCENANTKETLTELCALFALHTIEKDRAWFLEQGYMSGAKSKAIRKLVNQMCSNVRANALCLVDAFNIPDALLAAPIAFVKQGGVNDPTAEV